MNSFFFYDLETSGLNKAFDQVLQFAAIRTDTTFTEIERRNLTIRLRPDVIPSPGAWLTHRLPLDKAGEGDSELASTIRIHRWMNQPGTVSLGYNTLGFDDEFLRFAFYRNLLSPYTHQFRNGCGRMDLLPMTVLFFLYGPQEVQWPRIDGQPTLKLEHLAQANDLTQGPAHDAMVDVEATVALARRFSRSGPMWQYLAQAFDKNEDIRRIENLPQGLPGRSAPMRLGILAAISFGAENSYQVPALLLGRSIPYPNQTLWLRLDLETLQETTNESVQESTWVIRKKNGEPPMVLPPRERFWKRLGRARDGLVRDNIGWLKSKPDLMDRIVDFHRRYRYPDIPDLDPDAALYQEGFFTRKEETWCQRFHASLPGERPALLKEAPSRRLGELGLRLLIRNDPGTSAGDLAKSYKSLMARVNPDTEEKAMVDHRGQRRTTPRSALAEIQALEAQNPPHDQAALLQSLKTYIYRSFDLPGSPDG